MTFCFRHFDLVTIKSCSGCAIIKKYGQKNKNEIMDQAISTPKKLVAHEEATCYVGFSWPKFIL